MLSYCKKFLKTRVHCKVAAINLTSLDTYKYPAEVEWKINQDSKQDHLRLAKTINEDTTITGVIVQHEYGIFGGVDGEYLLYFMRRCTKPMLVTLHTMLPFPSDNMKRVTQEIISLASSVVVLTESSKNILEQLYPESIGKAYVIPHGIHPTAFSDQRLFKNKLELRKHTILSTFGLLSRGKGLEYVLHALPEVIKKYPTVLYLILGETHPVILREEGERYRNELLKLITKLNLKKHVKFYDQYLSLDDLFEFLKATDIYISTSTNPNQAVSGTLSYALGVGRPVISTEFSQAKEIITPDIGKLVPIKNSQAITAALVELLSDRKKLKAMSHVAYTNTRNMVWSTVAEKYITLLTRGIVEPLKIDYLSKLTDTFGLLQFATFTTPDKHSGYTLDDNARALILCSWLFKEQPTKKLEHLMTIYLAFIKQCMQPDGTLINYIDFHNKLPTNQNAVEDLEDAQARALWALSEIISNHSLPTYIINKAKKMMIEMLKNNTIFGHLRARAFAIKGYALAYHELPEYKTQMMNTITVYADSLMLALKQHSDKSWIWFEDKLQYSNGLLPESLIIAGTITKRTEYTDKGLITLNFLIGKTFSPDMYRPIGHSHWYKNNQKRSHYDQQPEDPASMILVLNRAYHATRDERYKRLAKKCYSWFLGNNTLHISLYDKVSGGCYDGLHPDRVNLNQGAESLLSYLMSSYTIKTM